MNQCKGQEFWVPYSVFLIVSQCGSNKHPWSQQLLDDSFLTGLSVCCMSNKIFLKCLSLDVYTDLIVWNLTSLFVPQPSLWRVRYDQMPLQNWPSLAFIISNLYRLLMDPGAYSASLVFPRYSNFYLSCYDSDILFTPRLWLGPELRIQQFIYIYIKWLWSW